MSALFRLHHSHMHGMRAGVAGGVAGSFCRSGNMIHMNISCFRSQSRSLKTCFAPVFACSRSFPLHKLPFSCCFVGFFTTNTHQSWPEHTILTMPALSPTMERGTMASWKLKPGDHISAGQVMAEVETDKATVAFEAVEEGYLAKVLVEEGTHDVEVGKPVAIMVEKKEDVQAFENYTMDGKEHTQKTPEQTPTPTQTQTQTTQTPAASIQKEEKNGDKQMKSAHEETRGRVMASPLAKKTAHEREIDMEKVKGTGPNGRIVAADVREYDEMQMQTRTQTQTQTQTHKATASEREEDYKDIPNSNVRKVIAKRLLESKQQVPHYYVSVEIRMDKLLALRAELNSTLGRGDAATVAKLSVNDFIVKAAALALRKVPTINARWQEEAVRQYNYVDISVAVATDGGLITPIIKNADRKGLATISKEAKELAARARENKLQPQEFQGGTFTISNLGMYGVDHFTAIINPPQAAILAIGSSKQVVVVDESAGKTADGSQPHFKVANVMTVTLSSDHRVADGAVSAQFLAAFKGFMESPNTMLL